MSLAKANIYTAEDYYNVPEDVRSELIDGELIYNLAAPTIKHQTLAGELFGRIWNRIKSKGGSCMVFPAPHTVNLYNNNKTLLEPDISVVCDCSKISEKCINGAPDWVIEIVSPGSINKDYFVKLNLYKNAGVKEYWIVDPMKESILVYCLEDEHFNVESYKFKDRVKANIFEDFYIDFSEMEM
ncbi:MAG: Uma2 family endonuclease [Clostridiales bacterium]|nr:Uma2 family endonuclease [Clostridiales bacterium]